MFRPHDEMTPPNIVRPRALPGESWLKAGAGVLPMSNLALNWASGIPRLDLIVMKLQYHRVFKRA